MGKFFDRKQLSSSESDAGDYPERRSGKDRRANQFPGLKYIFFYGRRAKARRDADLHRTFYFDRYSSKLFAAIVTILLLSVLDALLTLYLIDKGSSELNPIMSYFLNHGPFVFMSAKYFLTCVGVLTLLLFRNVFIKRSKTHTHHVFSYIIGAFSTVIAWQLYLIFFVVS